MPPKLPDIPKQGGVLNAPHMAEGITRLPPERRGNAFIMGTDWIGN